MELLENHPSRGDVEGRIGRPIHPEIWDFQPWGRRCVVYRLPTPSVTEGGLIIPTQAREPLSMGHLVRVGPLFGLPTGEDWNCPWVGTEALGRRVMFGKFAGTPLLAQEGAGEFEAEYILLWERDLFGESHEDIGATGDGGRPLHLGGGDRQGGPSLQAN